MIVISAIISGCKKYEKGPLISFQSKKSRVEGDWTVTSYSCGNNNWTDKYYNTTSSPCNSGELVKCTTYEHMTSFTMQFNKAGSYNWQRSTTIYSVDNDKTYSTCTACYDTNINNESFSGSWHFNSNKKELELDYFIIVPFYIQNSHYYGFGNPETISWQIVELSENRIELKSVIRTQTYILVLEKK
jgi:hypothetical protein